MVVMAVVLSAYSCVFDLCVGVADRCLWVRCLAWRFAGASRLWQRHITLAIAAAQRRPSYRCTSCVLVVSRRANDEDKERLPVSSRC